MSDFFANLYELNPLVSKDMGDFLRGWDSVSQQYVLTPWYLYIGWLMIALTALMYAFQYHIIDSSRCNKKQHWWFFALLIITLNFLIAFLVPFNALQAGDVSADLHLNVVDCIGFGVSNALWSLILFMLLTSFKFPRLLSGNCRHTTFWKP